MHLFLGSRERTAALAIALSACHTYGAAFSESAPVSRSLEALRSSESFDTVLDPSARSLALFAELSRVLTSPRCLNCHPADDSPRQGDAHLMHDPPVARGPEDRGVVGLECTSCHQDENAELARVPGAPKWRLAPKQMAWLGKTVPQICEQVKDPARNGGRSLAQLVDHSAHDELVAWGWHPGADRAPPPGDQARFGALVAAWVATGAKCPEDEPRPTKESPR